MTNKTLIKLTDNQILNVTTDSEFTEGCETCGFGAKEVTNIYIEFQDGMETISTIEQGAFYSYKNYYISMSDVIKIFTNNLELINTFTKIELLNWIREEIEKIISFRSNSRESKLEDLSFSSRVFLKDISDKENIMKNFFVGDIIKLTDGREFEVLIDGEIKEI